MLQRSLELFFELFLNFSWNFTARCREGAKSADGLAVVNPLVRNCPFDPQARLASLFPTEPASGQEPEQVPEENDMVSRQLPRIQKT
jgi:hypothetical protein